MTILPLGMLLDLQETGIDTELPFGLVLEKSSSQSDTVPRVVPEFQSKMEGGQFPLMDSSCRATFREDSLLVQLLFIPRS